MKNDAMYKGLGGLNMKSGGVAPVQNAPGAMEAVAMQQ